MKRNLIAAIAFVLIIAHIIPPNNIVLANEEENNCENMNFSLHTVKENDDTITGTGFASDQLKVEFITKNKTETVNINSNGKFGLKVEEEFLQVNDIIKISNDYYTVETQVADGDASDQAIQANQYVECPVIDEEIEPENTAKNSEVTEEPSDSVEISEEAKESEDIILPSEEPNNENEVSGSKEESEEKTSKEQGYVEEASPVSERVNEEEISDEEKNKKETKNILDDDEQPDIDESKNDYESTKSDSVARLSEEYEELFTFSFTEVEADNIPKVAGITNPGSLAEVQIIGNTEVEAILSKSDNPSYYNLNLNLNGFGIADVELVSPDRTVVFYSADLASELVNSNNLADVQVEILPINLEEDLPLLYNAIGSLTSELTSLVDILVGGIEALLNNPLTGWLVNVQGLTELTSSLDALNNLDQSLQDLTTYNGQVEYVINEDGAMVVNFSDGLGEHLETITQDIVVNSLNRIGNAIGAVSVGGVAGNLLAPIVTPTLNLLKGSVNTIINPLVEEILNGTTDLLDGLASAQVIGDTTVNLDVLVNNPPGNVQGTVPIAGVGIQATSIDVNLLTDTEGTAEVVFPDTTAPTLDTAVIEGNGKSGYTVSGTGATTPGDTVNVSSADGTIISTGFIQEDNSFSIILTGTVNPRDLLAVQAEDDSGNRSETIGITVPNDILRIESVPDIVFNTTTINDEEILISRKSADNKIQIMDTRREGNWLLSARADALMNNKGETLSNSVIYINNNYEEILLENDSVPVASDNGINSSEIIETISWSDTEGVLLRLNPIQAQADTEYTTTIEWTLTDGPTSDN